MEARETTPTEVTQRALTLCGAGGSDEVLPRVMGVHLNYSVSLYRNWVLGFWGSAFHTDFCTCTSRDVR